VDSIGVRTEADNQPAGGSCGRTNSTGFLRPQPDRLVLVLPWMSMGLEGALSRIKDRLGSRAFR
jgi:hypothetical protein